MKTFVKSIAAAFAAVITAAAAAVCGSAESTGFYTEKELALGINAPYDTKYVNILWNTAETETAGVPVSCGTALIRPAGNRVNKLSGETGELLGCAELDEKVSPSCRGAVSGNTLVQPTRSGIAVINVQTMQQVSSRSFDGTPSSDAAIIDSLAYIAVSGADGYTFYCVDLANGLETVWEYSSSEPLSAPSLSGDYVLFGAGRTLVSVHYKSGEYKESDIGAGICGAPFSGEYAVYLSAEDGNVYKLRLTDDGAVEPDTLTPCKAGGELSAPLAWNGRVYVCSSDGLVIMDSLNMEVTRTISEIKGGTAPLICYGNGPRVYTVAPLEDYWCLYSVLDADEAEAPAVSKLAKLENFEGGRIAAAQNGTLYFRDGIGRVYALAVAQYSILLIVVKLVLLAALFVLVFMLLRKWAKQRSAKRPPQF